jgi:hypothetical protein
MTSIPEDAVEKAADGSLPQEAGLSVGGTSGPVSRVDIEHIPVKNDPRRWSSHRKVCTAEHPVE